MIPGDRVIESVHPAFVAGVEIDVLGDEQMDEWDTPAQSSTDQRRSVLVVRGRWIGALRQ